MEDEYSTYEKATAVCATIGYLIFLAIMIMNSYENIKHRKHKRFFLIHFYLFIDANILCRIFHIVKSLNSQITSV